MLLFHQNVLIPPIPSARPVFVGPAEAKRKIRLARGQQPVGGHVQKPTTVEPVVIKAEALDAGSACHGSLLFHDGGIVEVVIPEVGVRDMGLVVIFVLRNTPAHIGPVRESVAPPLVVLRNGVELG